MGVFVVHRCDFCRKDVGVLFFLILLSFFEETVFLKPVSLPADRKQRWQSRSHFRKSFQLITPWLTVSQAAKFGPCRRVLATGTEGWERGGGTLRTCPCRQGAPTSPRPGAQRKMLRLTSRCSGSMARIRCQSTSFTHKRQRKAAGTDAPIHFTGKAFAVLLLVLLAAHGKTARSASETIWRL